MMRTQFATLAVLLLAALWLAGCGGGGGDGVRSDLQDQIDMLTTDLEAARAEVMRLEALIGTEADSDSLRGQLAAAQLRVRELEGDVRIANNEIASLRRRLTDAQADVTEAQQQAREAEQEAGRRIDEAERQANASLLAQPFIAPLDTADRRNRASVEWMRGDSLKVQPGDGDFARGSAAPSISGFRGFSFARQTGTPTALIDETAYVYTNIQTPGTKAFWKKYGLTEPITSDNAGMARASGTARATTVDGAKTTRLSGSFDGAGGTFTCTGDCTADVTITNGVPSFNTPGNWTFTPGRPTNTVTLNQDEEFLYFGIWSSVPNVVTASPTVGFEVIHGGSQPPFTDVAGLSGTYRFSGGAIGRYAITRQVGQEARIGTFTADASLTAVMGAMPTLGGSIRNFRENGNTLSGWSVTLGDTTGAAVAFAGGTAASADGATASIGGVPATGAWSATLYGSGNDPGGELSDANVYPAAQYPAADLAGVAGHFEAATTNSTAAIAGAFAATPQ